MYEVKIINDSNETIINAVSTSSEAPRITGQCKFGINTIDSFTFNILPNNEGYNLIKDLKTLVEVNNIKTNKNEFRGRVLIQTPKMNSSGLLTKSITCESELGYLMDSVQSYGEYHNITVRGFLELIINNHNKQVSEDKHFTVGIVDVIDNNDSLYRYLGYDKTLDTIKDKLINKLGGELRVRHENGIRYLDYVQAIGDKKDTEIVLAKNLITIEQERDPSEVITRLIPLGAKLESDERLTIESVNSGLNYIDDEEAISELGIIVDTVSYDDVTVVENLLRKGKEYLKENNKIKKKHKVTALDLSTIGLDIDSFEVGNTYRVINQLMNIDEDLRVIEKTLDINSPQSSSLSIGDKFEDIKDYQLDNIATAKEVKSVKETVQTTVNALNSVSVELNNTVEILNNTNENMGNLNEIVKANVDATNAIANTLVSINNKLDKLTRRINMEV
ncbi:phage tail protein [uncultured Clostridium sp.]|uniref:phage tail protein n=1 Tax=uncultured Clostridium sp. TaxID=59620 RepID=UPI00267130B1|nr:phage tail protein [uncultured Clostridium sp.]